MTSMRSKMKIYLKLGVITATTCLVSCDDTAPVLPPKESAEGKLEREALEKEAEGLKEEIAKAKLKQEKLAKNTLNLDDYTLEGLKNDTSLDPSVRAALLRSCSRS